MKKTLIICLLCISAYASAQNVGIGTPTPLARFHVADGDVLFSASGDVPLTPGNTPVSGVGRRVLWYADKAAFRVGYVSGTNWDKDSIGNYSFATGINTKAIGSSSTAMGSGTIASGSSSTAIGSGTIASGYLSIAMGSSTAASGYTCTTMGGGT